MKQVAKITFVLSVLMLPLGLLLWGITGTPISAVVCLVIGLCTSCVFGKAQLAAQQMSDENDSAIVWKGDIRYRRIVAQCYSCFWQGEVLVEAHCSAASGQCPQCAGYQLSTTPIPLLSVPPDADDATRAIYECANATMVESARARLAAEHAILAANAAGAPDM